MHQGKFQQNQMRSLRQNVVVEGGRNKRFILLGIIPSKLVTRLMSITRLETHQSSSQQIKIMTHITPGEIIAIPNKCQIPWTDLINTTPAQGQSPCNQNGIQLRCDICESMYHMAQNCPEKYDLYYTQQVILFQSDFNHPEQIKNLASESWNAAVLDGATNTAARKEWYNCYISSLCFDRKQI